MIEAGQKIREFERRVMWRKRWLALQDRLALALTVGGLLSAAFVLYVRLRVVDFPVWAIAAAVFGVIAAALGVLWYATRAREREAAFLIDEALGLEDRVSSAALIIERGGPGREVEHALLDDAAQYISGKEASEVLPYRLPRWYGLAAAGLVVLGVAIFIPQKSLPGGEALAEERASIEIAGEQLEQAAQEVEQIAPRGTETATLAQEQAELGRALRRSNDTRAEALKKLGTLGERIQQRHDELASTRADEIVSIAQKRLGSALASISKPPARSNAKASEQPEPGTDQDKSGVEGSPDAGQGDRKDVDSAAKPKGKDAAGKPENSKDRQPKPSNIKEPKDGAESKSEDSAKGADAGGKSGQPADKGADKQKPSSEAGQSGANQQSSGQKTSQEKGSEEKGSQEKSSGQKSPAEAPKGEGPGEEPKGEPEAAAEQKDSGLFPTISNLPNAVTNAMTEQAAKALPSLSEQLLKKAEQLRANELKPEDIQQLRQAAEFLAKDLSQIAQSKELLQAVEQMARQINPEQLERVAEQLLNQEKVRKELEAAARLLSQNRQIRDFVAGLQRDLEKLEKPDQPGDRGPNGGDEKGPQLGGNRPGQDGTGAGRGGGRNPRGGPQNPAAGDSLNGKGKETRVGGVLERKPGGEYLYLQTRPGTGAARLPYSSAYPQYRRQAERSVERSNVPPHMRSVVRNYFDAINPDGRKQ